MSDTPLRLLLIEDSFAVARELQALLREVEGESLHLQHVETLGQALKLLGPRRQGFDCVLVNLHLSDAEGLTAVRRLRTLEPHSAIVVMASPEYRVLAVDALRHGAQDVLVMPWLRTAEVARDVQRLVRGAIARRDPGVREPAAVYGESLDPGAPPAPSVVLDHESAFDLRFQPWAETATGGIHGVEAMLGSRSAQGSPRELLSAAESRGELDALSQWMLRRIAPLWLEWRQQNIAPPRVSVNLAPSELGAPRFARTRLALIEELGLKPRELQVELAEDALIGADVKALGELQLLREAGVRVLADNVGRSQVALLALARLPLDGVKLDISLIESVRMGDRASRAAVRGLVGLTEELGIQCCAVGVEVEPDARACRELGVRFMQGYWVGRPQGPKAIAGWLAKCLPPPRPSTSGLPSI